jgi:hypothetical protein
MTTCSRTDLRGHVTSIRWQITQLGWETAQGPPKSDAGERQVALDADTGAGIRVHRQRQQKEKEDAGDAWTDSGFEFTSPDGTPPHPPTSPTPSPRSPTSPACPPSGCTTCATARPPSFAAGHHMKVVQATLGLYSITIPADTYTSVLPQLARQSAEDVAALPRVLTGLLHAESRNGGRRMLRPYRRVVDPVVHRLSERMPPKSHPVRSTYVLDPCWHPEVRHAIYLPKPPPGRRTPRSTRGRTRSSGWSWRGSC